MKKIALFLAVVLLISVIPQFSLPARAQTAQDERPATCSYQDFLIKLRKDPQKGTETRSVTRKKTVSYIEMPNISVLEGTYGYYYFDYSEDFSGTHRMSFEYDPWGVLAGALIIHYSDGSYEVAGEDVQWIVSFDSNDLDHIQVGNTVLLHGFYETDFETDDIEFTFNFTVRPLPIKLTKLEITGPERWYRGSYYQDYCPDMPWYELYKDEYDESHYGVVDYYDPYYCYPSGMKAYFSDGTVITMHGEDGSWDFFAEIAQKCGLSEEMADRLWNIGSYQTPQHEWGKGKHTAEIGVLGQVFDYTVTVVDNPIKSVKVNNIVIEEGTCSSFVEEWDSDYETIIGEWYYYFPEDLFSYTVTQTNGTQKTYYYFELRETFGGRYPNTLSEQTWDSRWGVGTHNVTVEFGGKTCDAKVDIVASSCPSRGYSDVPGEGNWAHAGIDFCLEKGIMGSTSTNALTFEPNKPCTRAMIVTILYNMAGSPSVSYTAKFPDVPKGTWFTNPVIWAYQNGVVTGYDNGKFGPNDKITREQMAVILKAYTQKVAHRDTSASASLSSFPDASKVTWSKAAVSWAVAEGLISGIASGSKTYIEPAGNATRAQVATILMSYYNRVLTKPVVASYADVIRQAITRKNALDSWVERTGEGFLCDIDGNGTNELIMLYSAMPNNDFSNFAHIVCSVYTQENGTVKPLIEELPLQTIAGGVGTMAGVARVDGKRCLVLKWGANSYDPPESENWGEWFVYDLDGTDLELTAFAEYDVVLDQSWSVVPSKSYTAINGAEVEPSVYEAWEAGITWIESIDGFDYSTDSGISLENLLTQCGG